MDSDKTSYTGLPPAAIEYIDAVIKKMRYRRKVRADVRAELVAHFEDALRDCDSDDERTELAADLIAKFGEPKILAKLIRRGKKRCRPLWQQVIAQAAGIIAVVFLLYTAWFVTGKPVIETDYLAVLNQKQRDIKVGLSDDNNAWYDYEKVEQLLVEPTEEEKKLIEDQRGAIDREMTDSEKETVRCWIKANEPAWQHLVAGTNKQFFCFEAEYGDENKQNTMAELSFPIHRFWRHLLYLGFWQMKTALDEGRTQEALDHCLTMLRVAPQFSVNSYWLIEHMMACLSTRSTLNYILYIVDTNDLSTVQLKTLQEKLAKIFPNGYPTLALAIEAESAHLFDAIQRNFTDGGPGGGHLLPSQLSQSDNWSFFDDLPKVIQPLLYTGASMVHAGRDETMAMVIRWWGIIVEESRSTPYQWHVSGTSVNSQIKDLPEHRYFLIGSAMPIMRGRFDSIFQAKADYEAVITILALERWKLDKGKYPENLDELVENDYITAIPMDPYSDEAIVYKMTEDGFTLYSVGPDFNDDSGQMGKDPDRDPSWNNKWEFQDGDAVFWPVWKDEN